jgi:hypothetical protein
VHKNTEIAVLRLESVRLLALLLRFGGIALLIGDLASAVVNFILQLCAVAAQLVNLK